MFGRLAVILLCLLMVGCQSPAYQEQGWASYIADGYAGRMTSSGQVYHPGYSTAAHNTLPFGTELTVENLATGRSVQVMVNDRFPSYPGRVINLSASAAQYIGMNPRQLSPVKLTARSIPQGGGYGPPAGGYAPQPSAYPASQNYAMQNQPAPAPYQAPTSMGQQPYVTNQAPMQQNYGRQAPAYPQQAGQAAPANVMRTAPVQNQAPAANRPSFFRRFGGGGTPNAESYRGGNAPPSELPVF